MSKFNNTDFKKCSNEIQSLLTAKRRVVKPRDQIAVAVLLDKNGDDVTEHNGRLYAENVWDAFKAANGKATYNLKNGIAGVIQAKHIDMLYRLPQTKKISLFIPDGMFLRSVKAGTIVKSRDGIISRVQPSLMPL